MYRVGSQVTWILKALFPCCALVGYGSAMMPTACTLWAWCRTCPWEPVMLGVSLTMSWTPRQKIANADGLAHKAYHHARVIMNDMQPTHPCLVSDWFTHKFHLYVISIIYLGQNVSHKDPSHRTISLNANYVVRFKNPMDMSQISHLDKQVFSGGNGILTAACQDTTVMRAPSYMELTSTRQCLRNFACTTPYFLMALAYRPASWAWGGGEVSHGQDNKRAPFIHQHAVTMATATCAAEVHQHSSCHQQ